MSDEHTAYEAIRRQIDARYNRWRWFINHLGVFLLVNAAVWLIVLTDTRNPWPSHTIVDRIIFTMIWLGFVLLHWINYRIGEKKDRVIQEEMERAEQRLHSKPKNRAELRLTDDGELIEDDSDWAADSFDTQENDHLSMSDG